MKNIIMILLYKFKIMFHIQITKISNYVVLTSLD